MQIKNTGFSLIEILVGIVIVSIVMVSAFQALSAIGVGKVKLIEQTQVEKQAYFAGEKFFEMIKKGGTIDYEEYWNRNSYDTTYLSGHFNSMTGFGNFGVNRTPPAATGGNKPYHCRSGDGDPMGVNGCLDNPNHNVNFGLGASADNSGGPQRYTQYSRQFIDRNSDEDNDGGDEDGDGDIINDDDDLHIGIGPDAFPEGAEVGELYLINKDGDERTYFRWNVGTDSDAPPADICDFTDSQKPTGNACLGTIEFLKLTGVDYGFDHNSGTVDGDGSQGDGIVDTWLIHNDFLPNLTEVVAGSNGTNYWQTIFPNSINVSNAEFYLYPNKDLEYSWRDSNMGLQIAPYLQLKMTLQPSWKQKRKIRGTSPSVEISTTIQLSDLDFR